MFDISAGCSAETCIWVLSKHFCPTASSAEKQVVPQFCSYFARVMYLEFFIGVSSRDIKLLEVMDCFLSVVFMSYFGMILCSIHDSLILFSFVALLLKF